MTSEVETTALKTDIQDFFSITTTAYFSELKPALSKSEKYNTKTSTIDKSSAISN